MTEGSSAKNRMVIIGLAALESPRENFIALNDTTAKTLDLEISQEVIASVKEIVY